MTKAPVGGAVGGFGNGWTYVYAFTRLARNRPRSRIVCPMPPSSHAAILVLGHVLGLPEQPTSYGGWHDGEKC